MQRYKLTSVLIQKIDMKSKIIIPLTFACVLIFFGSCQKEEHNHNDSSVVTANIDILTPVTNQEFDHGDSVNIKVNISSSSELHGYQLLLIRLSDNDTVMNVAEHNHLNTYNVVKSWVNNNSIHSDMKLIVKAFTDHDNNFVSKEVQFHCHEL